MSVLVHLERLPDGFARHEGAWGRLWRAVLDRNRSAFGAADVIVAGPEGLFEVLGPLDAALSRVRLGPGTDWSSVMDAAPADRIHAVHDLTFPAIAPDTIRGWTDLAARWDRTTVPLRRIPDADHPARMASRWFHRIDQVFIDRPSAAGQGGIVVRLSGMPSFVPGHRYWLDVLVGSDAEHDCWTPLPLTTFLHPGESPLPMTLSRWGAFGAEDPLLRVIVGERMLEVAFDAVPGAVRYAVTLLAEHGDGPEAARPFVLDDVVRFNAAAGAMEDAATGRIISGRQDLPALWERAGRCAAGTARGIRDAAERNRRGETVWTRLGPVEDARVDDPLALARRLAAEAQVSTGGDPVETGFVRGGSDGAKAEGPAHGLKRLEVA